MPRLRRWRLIRSRAKKVVRLPPELGLLEPDADVDIFSSPRRRISHELYRRFSVAHHFPSRRQPAKRLACRRLIGVRFLAASVPP